jgi:molecular chaperone HtpG
MFEKTKQNNIKLYVNNILITENSKEICPEWLSFLVGIVETCDIPLNISRENLQYNENFLLLKKHFIKKSIEFFKDIMNTDMELYKIFYDKYGKFIKFGVRDEEDDNNVSKLKELLIFKSLKSLKDDKDSFITLSEYVSTLKEGQKIIYYIINENYESIMNSPYIEKFKNKDYNVLFMTEPVDEYLMETFKEYNGYKFVCIGKGIIYLNDTDSEIELYNKTAEEYKGLCEYIKNIYQSQLLTVKISLYLTKTPCIIYAAEYGISANMEKILKAQTMLTHTNETRDRMHYKNLELNPSHTVIIKLKSSFDNNEEGILDLLNMLFTTALLHSGYNITFSEKYIENIYKMLEK